VASTGVVIAAQPELAPRPGRPRSTHADRAILDAALEQFAELGFEGLSIEGVAAGAGVAKATIYRRYPSKEDLILAACDHFVRQRGAPANTGSLRGDVEALVANVVDLVTNTIAGRTIPQMVAAAAWSSGLAAAHRAFIAERRAKGVEAIWRGVERGEVRADVDPEVAADLIAGPVFYRHLLSGGSLDARFRRAHVEQILHALAP